MSPLKSSFGLVQKIGKALMLPVSVLPIAGILLGVGSSHFGWIPEPVSNVMAQAGGAIFGNLPLIFAIAVGVGLAGNDGVAALAATVGFAVLVATMGVMAQIFGIEPKEIMGMKSIDTGVFGGILIGAIAAYLFKRFYRIQLPPYLGFFAGKRFVPIVTAIAAIGVGIVLSLIWPPIQKGIDQLSHYAAYESPTMAAGLYGFVERLLIPFGLHHIWNVPFFFEIGSFTNKAGEVVHGDINRFFAGDPTAGILGGAYLFKMWGLPAAGLAIWRCARPEQKAKVGSIMISAALTSFLTGITEPLEFSFLFIAPVLYAVHAVLAGAGQVLFGMLGAKLGFTFSQGAIDYVLYYSMGTKPWLVLIFGPMFGMVYYGVFRGLIVALNLKTPGREPEETGMTAAEPMVPAFGGATGLTAAQERAIALVRAFGGRANIKALDACITRLRVELHDLQKADSARLKALGASGVLTIGTSLQAIFGPASENLKTDMEIALEQNLPGLDGTETFVAPAQSIQHHKFGVGIQDPHAAEKAAAWIKALGGAANIESVEACAATRLRVVMKDQKLMKPEALKQSGVLAIMPFGSHTIHMLVGLAAPAYAQELGKATGKA